METSSLLLESWWQEDKVVMLHSFRVTHARFLPWIPPARLIPVHFSVVWSQLPGTTGHLNLMPASWLHCVHQRGWQDGKQWISSYGACTLHSSIKVTRESPAVMLLVCLITSCQADAWIEGSRTGQRSGSLMGGSWGWHSLGGVIMLAGSWACWQTTAWLPSDAVVR